jgi:hypothetical protein
MSKQTDSDTVYVTYDAGLDEVMFILAPATCQAPPSSAEQVTRPNLGYYFQKTARKIVN